MENSYSQQYRWHAEFFLQCIRDSAKNFQDKGKIVHQIDSLFRGNFNCYDFSPESMYSSHRNKAVVLAKKLTDILSGERIRQHNEFALQHQEAILNAYRWSKEIDETLRSGSE